MKFKLIFKLFLASCFLGNAFALGIDCAPPQITTVIVNQPTPLFFICLASNDKPWQPDPDYYFRIYSLSSLDLKLTTLIPRASVSGELTKIFIGQGVLIAKEPGIYQVEVFIKYPPFPGTFTFSIQAKNP